MPFGPLPKAFAWQGRDARIGFEVVFFEPRSDGYQIEGYTTAIEDGQPWAASYAIDLVPVAPNQHVTTADGPGYDARAWRSPPGWPATGPSFPSHPTGSPSCWSACRPTRCGVPPPGGQVTVATRPAGPSVQITVTDTGDGIAAPDLPHIFERFYRARHGS